MWDTFDGWWEKGFVVKRGEKSKLRSDSGYPLFHISQVEEHFDGEEDTDHHMMAKGYV